MSTGMRKWMEKDCPEIEHTPAQELIDREELKQLRAELDKYKTERDELRAKIEQMGQQEPSRMVTPTAYRWRYRGAIKWQYGELTEEAARLAKEHNHEVQALGILPAAQPAPSVPDGVAEALQRLIENGAVLGPASSEDALLVARYRQRLLACAPSVPSVPEVTDAMIEAIESRAEQSYRRHHGGARGQQIVPADALSWHIIHATREVLSAAPGAKP